MEDKMKTCFRWLKLIKIAVFFLILFFLICYPAYLRMKQDQCMVQHYIITETLKKYVDSRDQIPGNLSELALLEYPQQYMIKENLSSLISFQKKKCDLRYYPDALGDPGRIFLQSLVLGTCVVTFGNGTRAVVSRWKYKEHRQLSEDVDLKKGGCRLYTKAYSGLIPILILFLCLTIPFFILVIVEHIIKKER